MIVLSLILRFFTYYSGGNQLWEMPLKTDY